MDDGAVVVLSGGADSCISLWWAKAHFKKVTAITFDYGQSHRVEIMAAHKIAQLAEVHHDIVEVRNVLRSTSPLTDKSQKLETYSDFNTMSDTIGDRVELTFVPLRNTLFLTIAANYAVYYGYNNLVTGVCQEDNANYPDCTRRFVGSMQWTVNESLGLAQTPPQFHIHTPLMHFSKAESVIEALKYDGCYAALAYSHTAYSGEFPPVTQDHATVLRAHGFLEALVPDPLIVKAYWMGLLDGLPTTSSYLKYEHVLASLPVLDDRDLYRKLYNLELLLRNTKMVEKLRLIERLEEWRLVPDWPKYEVSNFGKVRRVFADGRVKIWENKREIDLSDKPFRKVKTISIAKLVLLAFVEPPPSDIVFLVARHLDDDCTNNHIDNVAWGSQKDNVADAFLNGKIIRKPLSDEQKAKLSVALKGKNKGRKHSEEYREACRVRAIGNSYHLGHFQSDSDKKIIGQKIKNLWENSAVYDNRVIRR